MTPRSPGGARRGRGETRVRLLEAGREILRERGPSGQVDVLLTEALDRAGFTTGAGYPIFGSKEGYQRELAVYVAAGFEWAGPEAIADELTEILSTSSSLEETIRRAASSYLRVFVSNEDFYLALRFWAVREPWPELDNALAEGYRMVHDGFRSLFEGVLAIYDRRVRAPVTIDEITIAVSALTEGLALRYRIEAAQSPSPDEVLDCLATLYGEGVIALANHFTESIDTPTLDPN